MKKAVFHTTNGSKLVIFEAWDENNDNEQFNGVLVTDQTYDRIQAWKTDRMKNNPNLLDVLHVQGVGFMGLQLSVWEHQAPILFSEETATFDFQLPKGYTRVYAPPKFLHDRVRLDFSIENDLVNCLGNFVFNLEHTFKTPFDDDDITKMRTAMMNPDNDTQWHLDSWNLHLLSINTELIMALKGTIQSHLPDERDLKYEFNFKEPEEICLMRDGESHQPCYYAVGREQVYSALSHRLSMRQQEGTMLGVMVPALSRVTESRYLRDTLDKLQILNSATVWQLKQIYSHGSVVDDMEYEADTLTAYEKYVAPGETFLRDGIVTSTWLMQKMIEKIEDKKGKKLTTVEKNSIIDLSFHEVRQHLSKRYPMSSFISRLISFLDVFRPSAYGRIFNDNEFLFCGFEAMHKIYEAILSKGDPKYTASPYEALIIEQLVSFDGPWFKVVVRYLKELEDQTMSDEIVTG